MEKELQGNQGLSNELGRLIGERIRSNMKFTLDLEEYSYKDLGRNDPRFKFFKKQLMANTYDMARALFEDLAAMGILEKTDYPEDIKDGYRSDTESAGSGYLNTKKFNSWLNKQ